MNQQPWTSRIAVQVHDQDGKAHAIQLAIVEHARQGTLTIQNDQGDVSKAVALARLQKSRDGKQMSCRVGMTTVTLSIEDDSTPIQIRIVARAFVPLFEATYTLSPEENQRLMTWVHSLRLDA